MLRTVAYHVQVTPLTARVALLPLRYPPAGPTSRGRSAIEGASRIEFVVLSSHSQDKPVLRASRG